MNNEKLIPQGIPLSEIKPGYYEFVPSTKDKDSRFFNEHQIVHVRKDCHFKLVILQSDQEQVFTQSLALDYAIKRGKFVRRIELAYKPDCDKSEIDGVKVATAKELGVNGDLLDTLKLGERPYIAKDMGKSMVSLLVKPVLGDNCWIAGSSCTSVGRWGSYYELDYWPDGLINQVPWQESCFIIKEVQDYINEQGG